MNKKHLTALMIGSGLLMAGGAFAGAAAAGPEGCDKAHGKGRGAAHFTEMDTNKDGKINLAEFTASRESWLAKVDTNKDGVATQAELDAASQAGRAEHAKARFEREDANKDARLTRDETRMPSAWFEKADANDDGALTLAELTEARKAGGFKHGNRGGKMTHFDQNGDGKVDRQELKKHVAERFGRLDVNKDGSLTSEEFTMRGHRGHRRGGPHGQPDGQKPSAPVRS
jgi:Ca2+-binding EF-hand superfamily protein